MDTLIEVMKQDFAEFHNTRTIERAKNLVCDTGMHVNHNEYPSYFFGDLDAKFILVHLNPKQKDNKSSEYEGSFKFKDFDDYIHFHQNFGRLQYGDPTNKKYKSAFDSKQIEFIKPFNAIDLNDDDAFVNLQKVIDGKLQLELIPFGSDNFKTNLMTPKVLKPYTDIVLETITSRSRDYIIFCGSIFEKLLKDYIVEKQDYSFKLVKKDGTMAKNNTRFSKVILNYKGQRINAGIAHSFAQQGLTGSIMNRYGQKCFELYNK